MKPLYNIAVIFTILILKISSNLIFAQSCSCDSSTLSCACCQTIGISGFSGTLCLGISFSECSQSISVIVTWNGDQESSISLDLSQVNPQYTFDWGFCSVTLVVTNIIIGDTFVVFTPTIKVCPGDPWEYDYSFSTVTIGIVSVCSTLTSCSTCVQQSGCGWCFDSGLCMDGNATTQACNKCNKCGWTPYGISCNDSNACLEKSSACGYCSTSQVCIAGDPSGPIIGSCDAADWVYLTCAQRVNSYITVQNANHNYAVIGSSVFFSGLAAGMIGLYGMQYLYKKGKFKRIRVKMPTFSFRKKPNASAFTSAPSASSVIKGGNTNNLKGNMNIQ